MNVDLDLAQRIEGAEAQYAGAYALACGGRTHSVAGGTAIFAGADSPFGKAVGLGLGKAVSSADLDAIEEVLGKPARIELSPFADASLARELAAHAYVVVEWNHVLVGSVARAIEGDGRRELDDARDVSVRTVRPGEESIWARVVNQGFTDRDDVSAEAIAMALPSTRAQKIRCVLAWQRETVVGASAMGVHDGIASLFGSAVRVGARRRGVQRAFIRERLAFAREHACDLVTACTLPGTGSQRNLERWGLRVAYPKVLMQRG